jgi:glycosyltransferase involved in cell wall biosynthesis
VKLSVIVPLYNIERYLDKCIYSLLKQDLAPADYEIIAVDDASPDGSRAVAESFTAANPNIRVITQANAGPGGARNRGLDEARGEWVMTVDGDDYLAPNVLGGMIAEMERERLDMLAYDFQGVDEKGAPVDWNYLPHPRITDPETITGEEYILRNEYSVMTHQYVFRRAFIEENRLRMLPHNRHEDDEFTPQAICLARRIRHYPKVVYYYVRREGSTMNTPGLRSLTDTIDAMGGLRRFVRSGQIRDPRVTEFFEAKIHALTRYVLDLNKKYRYTDGMQLLEQMREQGLTPIANPGNSLKVWMINHVPRLYFRRNRKKGK